MKKVEVAFETDFEHDAVLAIHIGRLHIGDHIMRLYFTPEGKVHACIPQAAVTDGSLVLLDPITGPLGFGHGIPF